ncbi:SRPBCC family protein [Williamsia sp. 1135]|uniref:SRPBCC family protein n=1 Tax=Williamsia sp. 1135 TaxID=1889262 RepID=UPI000A0FDCCF|nr:SRPBCC family protein [Williamsia sp. 1135]ORM32581.1 polyketide cyclase [Williamsia sp. 1135]
MVDVQRTFTVSADKEKVRTFLRDFANATRWDPGTQSCVQSTPGPVTLGTKWDNTSKIAGISTELVYELTRDDPEHIVLTGTNKTATSVDDIRFEAEGPDKTVVTYHAHVVFNGAAKLADPIVKLVFLRLADETEKQMTETLEAL